MSLTPEQERREERDREHAARLLNYLTAEISAMSIRVRMQFVTDLVVYCTPEVKQLISDGKLHPPGG